VLGGSAFTAIGDSVLAEWTVDGSNPPKVFATSRREVLRIPVWSVEHNADQAMFNPAAVPGTAEFGKLYLTVGDGGNYPAFGDPYDQAQDLASPLGKVLRLNPLKSGTAAFRYPPDNPHAAVGGVARLVWARGLRHPQNLCFDSVTGTGIVADIGQWQLEEVNLLARGANYGWPHREGTFAFVRDQPEQLYGLPSDNATRGYTYPVAQFGRPEGLPRVGTSAEAFWTAICGGFIYRGSAVPALYGHYLCGELCTGRIFHVPLASLVPGQQANLQELTLLRGGVPVTLRGLAAAPSGRADLRFGQGADGEVYLLTKQDGKIRRMSAPPAT
jgi:glucose/arabinose dehydrogenase